MLKHLLALLLLLLTSTTPLSAATVTDDVDRQVEVPDQPQRIISLAPSVTEILFAIEAGHLLTAVTDYSTYPEEARSLPSVGSYADPGLENILSYQPELVIATASMNSPNLIHQLEKLGIPVYVINATSVEETLATISTIGQLSRHEAQAEALRNDIESRIDRIQQVTRQQDHPGVLAAIVLQPLMVAGPDTFVNSIITIAGGHNVVSEGPSRYPTWNFEALLQANPDFILLSPHPGQPGINSFFAPWQQLTAVAKQQIIEINADWLYRPGPRMILGIEALAKTLHPNLDIDATGGMQ